MSAGQAPARRFAAAEVYGLLCAAFLAAWFGFREILRNEPSKAIPAAAAIVGFAVALFGGTALALPLYFGTTFSAQLAFGFLPVSLNKLLAAFLLLAFCLELCRRRFRFPMSWPLALFFLYQAYYIPVAVWKLPAEGDLPTQTAFYILLTIIVGGFYSSAPRLKLLLWSFSAVAVAMAVLPGAFEFLSGANITVAGIKGSYDRLNGLAPNAIVFSFTALWAIPPMLALWLDAKSLPAKAALLCAVFALMFLSVATANRQTPFILALVLLVFLLFVRSQAKATLLAWAILAAIVVSPFVAVRLVDRLARADSILKDESLTIRHDKWVVAMEAVKANPWLGLGHDHFKNRWREYLPKRRLLHIMYLSKSLQYVDAGYLQVLTEHGSIGLGLMLLTLAAAFAHWLRHYRMALRLADPWHANLLAAVAAMFAHLIISLAVQDNWLIPRTFLLFGLLAAACAAARDAFHAEPDPE